ncbi:MAG TPA: sigma-70 family RNA polymerase sigma factor [Ktedonobacterales bacterium]
MDERRFVAAVTPYLRDMVYVALALIGPAEAEDVAQEALLGAWKAAQSLREGDTARPWLLRITANVCHDWRRGRNGTRARITTLSSDAADEIEAVAVDSDDPGTGEAVVRLDLRRLVDALDDDLRVVIVLRYYAEMNASEIGAALGIPASTVRTRLQRAIAALRASGGFAVSDLGARVEP